MKQGKAALYLRSSKDRSDVSIDAQRRELRALAANRSLAIVSEYADVVISATDERRDGFQALLAELKHPSRQWDAILMYDTARLARDQHVAHVFRHECKKRGVDVIYATLPALDGIAAIMLPAVLHANDEVHSFMSRQKGLAGMAENVRKGYRAGGRAPRGYELSHRATGAIRDGKPVQKSVLVLSPDAPLLARYLKGRASGLSRTALHRELSLPWPINTLVDIEWNALTYAGHTVWNVHNDRKGGNYQGKPKRRPRDEWVIQRDTHPALITDDEAEQLLDRLRSSKSSKRRTKAVYLLTGVLQDEAGHAWRGNGDGHYRVIPTNGASRKISRQRIEAAVIEKIKSELISDALVDRLAGDVERYVAEHSIDPAAELRAQVKDYVRKISRMMELAAQMTEAAPALREIEALERRRSQALAEIHRLEQEYRQADAMRKIGRADIRSLLESVVGNMDTMGADYLKDLIANLVEKIVLSPQTLEYRIHYRASVVGNKVASPRVHLVIPLLQRLAACA